MDPSLVVWHLLGFVAPAFGVAALTAGLAKLLWRRDMQRVGWPRLTGIAAAGGGVVLVAGLVVFGNDGRLATYAALVGVCGTLVWWFGFDA